MHLKAAGSFVVFNQVVLLQDSGGRVHKVHPAALQQRVRAAVVMGDTIQRGVPQHPHIQVRVSQPVHSILTIVTKQVKNYYGY